MWIRATEYRDLLQKAAAGQVLAIERERALTQQAEREHTARADFSALDTERTTLRDRLVTAETAAAERQSRLLVLQQNFDWLANHVNRLEAERVTLLQHVLQVTLAAPVIRRTETPSETHAFGTPLPDAPPPIPGLADLPAGEFGFEDMGDAAAAILGISHDPTSGAVIYSA